ncbi:MAG: DUF3576 domain-containing protein [Alphaproteobacteria bacterium]|nr:DUF3576 domain-containing protein [Alphaproteobacteria bacterium]
MRLPGFRGFALGALALGLAACGAGVDPNTQHPSSTGRKPGEFYGKQESVFGLGGLQLFGKKDAPQGGAGQGGGSGVGVNSYLWRASLDTVSFMPLLSADPFGGVVITDWYSPPEAQSERFKMTVYILGRELRSDGIRVSVFRQVRDGGGNWTDAAVAETTPVDLENKILTRARQMRIAIVNRPS